MRKVLIALIALNAFQAVFAMQNPDQSSLVSKSSETNQSEESRAMQLFFAVQNGDLEKAQKLAPILANRIFYDTKTKLTPLHIAACKGYDAIAHILIQAGADVNAKAKNDETPLRLAAENNQTNMCKILLEAGANPNIISQDGGLPLFYAADQGNEELVILLLKYNADPNARSASFANHTTLHSASLRGHENIVTLLLNAGAEVDAQDDQGVTALLYAIRHKHLKVAELLLDGGADIEKQIIRNGSTATPLIFAAGLSTASMIDLLIKRGARINHAPSDHTPLMFAALTANKETIEALLRHDANPLMQTAPNNQSALMLTAFPSNHLETTRVEAARYLLTTIPESNYPAIQNCFTILLVAHRLANSPHNELFRLPNEIWMMIVAKLINSFTDDYMLRIREQLILEDCNNETACMLARRQNYNELGDLIDLDHQSSRSVLANEIAKNIKRIMMNRP